jgi:hypothetical protein
MMEYYEIKILDLQTKTVFFFAKSMIYILRSQYEVQRI